MLFRLERATEQFAGRSTRGLYVWSSLFPQRIAPDRGRASIRMGVCYQPAPAAMVMDSYQVTLRIWKGKELQKACTRRSSALSDLIPFAVEKHGAACDPEHSTEGRCLFTGKHCRREIETNIRHAALINKRQAACHPAGAKIIIMLYAW